MDKYSVDKENDPVEKRAQGMIKTGEAKSISKARRIAEEEHSGAHKQLRSGKDLRKKN